MSRSIAPRRALAVGAYVGIGNEGSPQIFIAGIDGTGVRQVTHDPTGAMSPAWSPDGTRIVCSGDDRAGSGPILVVDVETGEAMKVAKGRTAIWLDDHRLHVEV